MDRVIVSQLHRSPGAVFSQSKKVRDLRGKPYYIARIIPMRGSWLDFEFDSNDILYVRIDKKKKLLVTTFLQALGVEREKIISLFYRFDKIYSDDGEFYQKLDDSLLGLRIERGMIDHKEEDQFVGKRITKDIIAKLSKLGIKNLISRKSALINRVFGEDVVLPKTGEIIADQGQAFTEEHYEIFKKHGKLEFSFNRVFWICSSTDYSINSYSR